VPVIAIPLAFRRTASRAVEATNDPAVQASHGHPLTTGRFFAGKKIEIEPRLILKFWRTEIEK
jgi:hypothetical protein